MDAHAGFGAAVGREEEHFVAATAGGAHHAFAQAEFHLARGEIGDADHQATDELVGLGVGFFDSGEDGFARIAAEAEGEFQKFARVGDFLGGEDASDAEIDFGEVVDRAFRGKRFGG